MQFILPASSQLEHLVLMSQVYSVKYFLGGQRLDIIISIYEIVSQNCYHCVQYTRHHTMSLILNR